MILRFADFVQQLELVLSPSTAYVVDVLHSRSTEALAAIE